jgi:hypothetical protein
MNHLFDDVHSIIRWHQVHNSWQPCMTCQKLTLAFSTLQQCLQQNLPSSSHYYKLKLVLDLRSEIENKPVCLIFVLSTYVPPHYSWWQCTFAPFNGMTKMTACCHCPEAESKHSMQPDHEMHPIFKVLPSLNGMLTHCILWVATCSSVHYKHYCHKATNIHLTSKCTFL